MKMYKQFKIDKNGVLHPLFVNANEDIPVGEWLTAVEGERTASGKVKSKLGELAYRPGWHLSEAPYAPHIGIKEDGEIKYMKDDCVWAECEIYDAIDYTEEAHKRGIHRNGKFVARDACLDRLPVDGYYFYNTNPNAFGNWVIAHRIRVTKVLTDAEVESICWTRFGVHAQPHRMIAEVA